MVGTVTSICYCEESLPARGSIGHYVRKVPTLEELIGGGIQRRCMQNILLDRVVASGPVQGDFERFVAARQLSSSTIAVFPLGSSLLEPFKGFRTFTIDKFQFFSIIVRVVH